MNPGLAALAIGIVAAGVLATATRDSRSAIVASAVVAVAAPVLAGGAPEPLPLAARLVASILAAYLLWAAVRGHQATAGSPLGLAAEALLAAAAGTAAFAGMAALTASPDGRSPAAAAEAVAGGVGLVACAAAPLLAGRDALRIAVGALLAAHGAWLVRAGLVGPSSAVEELAFAGLVASLGAVGAALVVRARSASGGLEVGARRTVGPPRPRPVEDREPASEGGTRRFRGRRAPTA